MLCKTCVGRCGTISDSSRFNLQPWHFATPLKSNWLAKHGFVAGKQSNRLLTMRHSQSQNCYWILHRLATMAGLLQKIKCRELHDCQKKWTNGTLLCLDPHITSSSLPDRFSFSFLHKFRWKRNHSSLWRWTEPAGSHLTHHTHPACAIDSTQTVTIRICCEKFN